MSTDDQSIANQQMQIEEAGYNIAKWFTDEAVQTLISQGKTRLQIQEELGISRATYYRLAK